MADWGNLRNWFGETPRSRDLRETREAWNGVEALWRASPFASRSSFTFSVELLEEARDEADRLPTVPVVVAFADAINELLRSEDVNELVANWQVIEDDAAAGIEMREMLVRRRRWCADFRRVYGVFREQALEAYRALFRALPESCFGDFDSGVESFEVPLIELLDDPAGLIEELVNAVCTDETIRLQMFEQCRVRIVQNLMMASGFPPDDDPRPVAHRFKRAGDQRDMTGRELIETYLGGTPFAEVFETPIPFYIPEESRFEHCHIIGGTGHGKTQLMQRMIHADLVRAKWERRSVVVIDSQGDLINKLMRLDLFDPDGHRSLADRLVIVDPSDVEFPAALNLFDAHLDRVRDYRPVDRERVLNGVIELYETFFGSMLGAELTQKQGVIFRYLARLMISIPGATIHTLMQLMEDGKPFKRYMDDLDGSARYFFETEFFHPSFSATKKQILKRLWGVLSTPAFERMFAQPTNKLDLFEAMNDGKVVLVSTAKDLLKSDGSALFGRFFIALLAQAALERSTIDEEERTPTFVYVDEAQEYFDDSIETILNQARKYKVGLTLAHQTLDQLTPRLRSVLNANTSFKCVGGVSAKDARALADEMRTEPEFIERMRRWGDKTEFAVWLKHQTPQAIRLTVPIGFLERQPILTEEAFEEILEQNRERYCGTLDDVVGFEFRQAEPESAAHQTAEQSPSFVDEPARAVSEPGLPIQDVKEPYRAEHIREASRERPRPPSESRELGKGGPQHRYVQHLIKGLAEERGFRAIIEDAVDGGQVDVSLRRDSLTIACEISVTSKPEYEAQNIAKCLRAGFTRVWAIAPDTKRQRLIAEAAALRLSADDIAKVDFIVTSDVIQALDALSEPQTEETKVRGYTVRVSRKSIPAAEAEERRSTIARVVSKSIQGLDRGG